MAELELIPIHTRILTHHDNIVDAILNTPATRSPTMTSSAVQSPSSPSHRTATSVRKS